MYQLDFVEISSSQNVFAENLGGMTMLPFDNNGARRPACRPIYVTCQPHTVVNIDTAARRERGSQA